MEQRGASRLRREPLDPGRPVKVARGFTIVLDNGAEMEIDTTGGSPVVVATRGDVPADNRRLVHAAVSYATENDDIAYVGKQYSKHRLKPGYDITEEKLQEDTRIYREAKTDGRNALATVTSHFALSPSTAKDLCQRARAAGYLD